MEGRLESSLHNAVRLSLGMERLDSAVSRPYGRIWHSSEKPPEPLPAGMRIGEVFRQKQRQLLILGEPGAGKTTTMLELARELLDAAKEDNTQPIPVLVSLSSWKQPEMGIFDWLVAELKDKYGLRQDLGKAWLEKDRLLPLLDGLDEVTPKVQSKCAEAINTWLTGELEKQPCGVLVCCRREEFEKIVGKKLSLQGAIYLQPLTAMQIEEYFDQLELSDVWQAVGADAALQELLAKPLFLSMFGLVQAQNKFDLAAWQKRATSEAKIEYLFDTYWDAVMSRELILEPNKKNLGWLSRTYKIKPLPQRKAVRRMLVFIAKGMERDFSIGMEFSIEQMQPSWLPKRKTKRIFSLISGLIFGLISSLVYTLISGLIFGLIISLFNTLIRVESLEMLKIEAVEKISILRFARREIIKQIRINISYFLSLSPIYHLSFVLTFCLTFGSIFGSTFGLIISLTFGLIISLAFGLILVLIISLSDSRDIEIQAQLKPNQGIKNLGYNMAIVTTISVMVIFPIKLLLEFLFPLTPLDPDLSRRTISAILPGTIYAGCYAGGGDDLIKHIALRIVLAWNRYVPIRFDLLLDYCTERLLIQRIGGRYRFMHKLLQDHFAKKELD